MQSINTIRDQMGLLPLLIILTGVGGLIAAVAADQMGLSGPGFGANQFSLALSASAVLLTGLGLVSTAKQRRVYQWLLVVIGVIAVAVAAELLVVGSLPGFGLKQLMLASTTMGIVITGAISASADGQQDLREWLNQLLLLDRAKIARFLAIWAQLILLGLLIRQFELENQAFYANIMPLVLYGFVIHFFLPRAYRLSFFVLLSLVGIFGILGMASGIWLVAIGAGLIGLCHLPVPFSVRVLLLLTVGAGLALLRADLLPSFLPEAIWPVLASMFMFRLIIYVYDLKHSKEPVSFTRTLAYFFLLPNIVFPFFPVVDYSTFRRTYYKGPRFQIYQTGSEWMLRGVFQLIIYRVINYYFVLAPGDVTNGAELVQFILTNFLLYLRVSGQFHLVIGLLHLFGFNLPLTNNNYLLSSSFTDLWRRINIYWKDFMQKVFFYPAFFKLKGLGNTSKLIIATAVVFFATWFLHAYQWFWLRGTFLLATQDILFWTLLALLVMANTLYEARHGRQRSLGEQTWSWGKIAPLAVRTAATIGLLTVLWSLWTSSSVSDWLALWSVAASVEGIVTLLLAFLLMIVVLGMAQWLVKRGTDAIPAERSFFRAAAVNASLIGVLFLAGNPAVYSRIGGQAEAILADIRAPRLSDRDAELLQRGYYENLLGVNSFNSELWEVYSKRPTDWPLIQETEIARYTNDFFHMELVPSGSIVFHGAEFTTNRWGMRDREYELTPPPNSFRALLLGPSYVMGSGVANDQVFEALVEKRLNGEADSRAFDNYEILNMGMAGYSALQELAAYEDRGLTFEPDAVFLVAHQLEEEIVVRNLADRIRAGADMPYEYLVDVAHKAGVNGTETQVEAERLLKPYGTELVSWTYRRFVELSRERGIVPVWIFIPALDIPIADEDVASLMSLAEAAGFVTLDLSDVYEDNDLETIIVAAWDKHPNALGHRLVAERLYEALSPLGIVK